jgi:hypothetical protein
MRVPLLLAMLSLAAPALAQTQQLIPVPYPSGSDSARIPAAPPAARHQYLVPTPYERKLGPNALGNPHAYHPRRHQRLVKPPYPRQYR